MPTYQTTGIVIGRTNFGEANRVVRFLTPDHGKVSAVARGVRKIKSRAGGHLELFGEVNLVLATGRNLDVITSAQLSWYPHALSGAYDQLNLAFAIAESIDRVTQSHHPQPKIYALLKEAIRALDAGAGGPLTELWFKLRLLEHLGYRPELNACLVCGRHDSGATYYFDAARGGLTCRADATAGATTIPETAIKLWRLLSDYPHATIAQVAGAPTLAAQTLPLCDDFYRHHLGKSFHPILTKGPTP